MIKSKLFFKLLIAMAVISGCQKHDFGPAEKTAVTFTLNIAPFSIDKTSFSMEDTIFNSFKHQYHINPITIFLDENGNTVAYPETNEGLTIEESIFTLPVGTYTIKGDGGPDAQSYRYSSTMPYTIEETTIEITPETKSIPIKLIPNCFLILLADPYKTIITTNKETDAVFYDSIGRGYFSLASFNSYLRYLYVRQPVGAEVVFQFTKTDKTIVKIDADNFENGYIYKIFVNQSSTDPPSGGGSGSSNVSLTVMPVFITEDVYNY